MHAAEGHLHLEQRAGRGTIAFDLYYRPPVSRPISILSDTSRVEIRAFVDEEVNDWLADAMGPGADQVRAHVARVREVVTIELGFPQLEDRGIVIADEVARWVATIGDGSIKDVDHAWLAINEWSWIHLYPPPKTEGRP